MSLPRTYSSSFAFNLSRRDRFIHTYLRYIVIVLYTRNLELIVFPLRHSHDLPNGYFVASLYKEIQHQFLHLDSLLNLFLKKPRVLFIYLYVVMKNYYFDCRNSLINVKLHYPYVILVFIYKYASETAGNSYENGFGNENFKHITF